MSSRMRALAKRARTIYAAVAFVLGTASLAAFLGVFVAGAFQGRPASHPDTTSMRTGNGFIIVKSRSNRLTDTFGVTDERGNLIVAPDVIDYVACRSAIYGYRRDETGRPVYFFCDAGADCSGTQTLGDAQLRRRVEQRGFPSYVHRPRYFAAEHTGLREAATPSDECRVAPTRAGGA